MFCSPKYSPRLVLPLLSGLLRERVVSGRHLSSEDHGFELLADDQNVCSPSTFASSSRCLATAAAEPSTSAAPPPPAPAPSADPKLNKIVDDISGLTLLQAADLVSLLKVKSCLCGL